MGKDTKVQENIIGSKLLPGGVTKGRGDPNAGGYQSQRKGNIRSQQQDAKDGIKHAQLAREFLIVFLALFIESLEGRRHRVELWLHPSFGALQGGDVTAGLSNFGFSSFQPGDPLQLPLNAQYVFIRLLRLAIAPIGPAYLPDRIHVLIWNFPVFFVATV